MRVSIHAAKTRLSELIEAACDGAEVVITRGGRPLVTIVPVRPRNGFKFGLLEGLVGTAPDFLEPMTEDELAAWGEDD